MPKIDSSQNQGKSKFKLNLIGENDIVKFIGSTPGIFLSFVCSIVCLMIFINIVISMQNGEKDLINQFKIENDMQKFGKIDMSKQTFTPYFIIKMKNIQSLAVDILDNNVSQIYNKEFEWKPIIIDVKKLSRYLSIRMLQVTKVEQNYTSIHHMFRQCTKKDFNDGIWDKIPYKQASLCPNIYNDKYYELNKNFDYEDYSYLQLSVIKCDKSLQDDCKSDEEINQLLENFYLELYIENEFLDFDDKNLFGIKPIKTKIEYIGDHVLSLDKTKFTHFELAHNLVQTNDYRYSFWNYIQQFEFLEFSIKSSYDMKPYAENDSYSVDGINFQDAKLKYLLHVYITISNTRIIHKRIAYNVFDALSKLGGLANGIIVLLLLINIDLNYNIMMGDFIQKMYFPFIPSNIKKFSYMDQIGNLWFAQPFKIFFQPKQLQLYEKLKSNLEKSINIVDLITRFQKLSIMMSALMNYNQLAQKEAEQKYLTCIQQIQENLDEQESIYLFIDQFAKQMYKQKVQKRVQDVFSIVNRIKPGVIRKRKIKDNFLTVDSDIQTDQKIELQKIKLQNINVDDINKIESVDDINKIESIDDNNKIENVNVLSKFITKIESDELIFDSDVDQGEIFNNQYNDINIQNFTQQSHEKIGDKKIYNDQIDYLKINQISSNNNYYEDKLQIDSDNNN